MRIRTIPATTLLTMVGLAGATAGVALGIHLVEAVPAKPVTVRTVSDTASATPSASDTPTPTVSSTPEGDDGSLGGPVYNSSNTATPTYIIRAPQAAVIQDTPTDTATTTTDTPTASDSSSWNPDGDGNATPASRVKGPDGRDSVEPATATPTEEISATATG